jgi:hypothetical protein
MVMDVDTDLDRSRLSGGAPCRRSTQTQRRHPACKKISARFAWRIIWQIERRRAAGA